MTMDRSFIELNRASRERMQALAERLTDKQMLTKVGEHWTVAIVYAHICWWDRRVIYVLDMTEKNGKLFIPEIDIFVNDLSLPLWAAVPPREEQLEPQRSQRFFRGASRAPSRRRGRRPSH